MLIITVFLPHKKKERKCRLDFLKLYYWPFDILLCRFSYMLWKSHYLWCAIVILCRGNQAYKDGDLSKAEDFYTLGINSIPPSDSSGSWVEPLLLCYSNRAATRMGLGRIREALGDCSMATTLDPTFLKVHMRTAK